MMKSRPWTLDSLKEVGGTTGVGATFLEETISASEAPPAHRYHQVAARAVLRSLLPSGGTEIKGHRRSRVELLEASGYAFRDRDFADLMRILDSELRLITPVDITGVMGDGWREMKKGQTEGTMGVLHYRDLLSGLRNALQKNTSNSRPIPRHPPLIRRPIPTHTRLPCSIASRLADSQTT